MRKLCGIITCLCMLSTAVLAQITVGTEAQLTTSSGEHTPLWLNANKYGLSSLDKTNGYLRANAFRSLDADSARQWAWGAGADVAVATGFTSTVVVQQAYADVRWKKGLLTVGSKEQPMEMKNQHLSSGSQTLGINARPVPSIRLSLPMYWDVPGTKGFLGFKGHLAYGLQTDDGWQKDFTQQQNKHTEHTRIHTKAGYLRFGKSEKPFTVEAGLEMGCQYGGTAYVKDDDGNIVALENTVGLKGAWRALIPSGGEAQEKGTPYENAEGNHMGSWLLRLNYERETWGISAYADHYFEDQSSMFFLDYNGYGTGEKWNEKESFKWFVYDLRDALVGVELRLKRFQWVDNLVVEYLYTKYQSGPIYHDHTQTMRDHVSGKDNYYNHYVFTGWQHWGQVIGNPLYLSPLYNDDGQIIIKDNRFWAWHIGLSGRPAKGLDYRLLCSWQRGFGTYSMPYLDPQRNVSMLAEASYRFPAESTLSGWRIKAAAAFDRGGLLGNNTGFQLTLGRQFTIEKRQN